MIGQRRYQTLQHRGDVSADAFRHYLRRLLDDRFPRALELHRLLGPVHSYSLSNMFYLAAQKGNVDPVLEDLEWYWSNFFVHVKDLVDRGVQIKLFFDNMYLTHFANLLPAGASVVTPDGATFALDELPRRVVLPRGARR